MSNKAATIGDIGTDHDGFPPHAYHYRLPRHHHRLQARSPSGRRSGSTCQAEEFTPCPHHYDRLFHCVF